MPQIADTQIQYIRKDEHAAMSALNELIEILTSYTSEQLEAFLKHPVTLSTLQPAEAAQPFLEAES